MGVLGNFLGQFHESKKGKEMILMYRKDYKQKCVKFRISKSEEPVRAYSRLMEETAMELQLRSDVETVRCNVLMDGTDYTTDFVCRKTDGTLTALECVYRKHLSLPKKCKLLDMSQDYWSRL